MNSVRKPVAKDHEVVKAVSRAKIVHRQNHKILQIAPEILYTWRLCMQLYALCLCRRITHTLFAEYICKQFNSTHFLWQN